MQIARVKHGKVLNNYVLYIKITFLKLNSLALLFHLNLI